VASHDERHGLLVVHRHAPERLSDVLRGEGRVWVAAWALRIHIDQAHVIGGERSLNLSLSDVALVPEPGIFRSPEDFVGLPDVGAPESEAKRLEPHRLVGHVAGKNDQIRPGDLATVFLLDRPEQPAGLVEVRIVWPAVEGWEALRALSTTAPAVGDPVRARGVPRHPDEKRAVVPVVRRPPLLRRRHELHEIPLERFDIEGLELLRVVVVLAHRIGPARVLVENRKVHLIGPPVFVGPWANPLGSRGRDRWILTFAGTRRCILHLRDVPLRHVPPPFWLFPYVYIVLRGCAQFKATGAIKKPTVAGQDHAKP